MTDHSHESSANLNRGKFLAAGGAAVAATSMLAKAQAQQAPATGEEPLTPAQSAARKVGASAPSPASNAAGLIASWSDTLAIQAATYASAIVAMYNLRSTVAVGPGAKAPPGQIWRFMDIASPKIAAESGYVTPNVNVIYGFGFVDLGQEPYILTAPDSNGRYYMIELVDMWTNAFFYPAGAQNGYKGGTFALVGPGWTGTLPNGVTRVDCPTRWVELQPRVYVKDTADLPGARDVMNAIKLQSLSAFNGTSGPAQPTYDYDVPRVNPKVASSQMQFDDPLQFWSIFVSAMNENPPPKAQISDVLPQYRWLGIEFGKPWDSKSVKPVFLEAMKKASAAIAPMMDVAAGPLYGTFRGGWGIPPANVGNAGADYLTRSGIAILGLTANAAQEALYYSAYTDSAGGRLNGAKRYTVTFAPGALYTDIVQPGFWSLTMYDLATKYTVPNPIDRYALGGDSPVKKNADGSFTMYLQHDNPGPDKESNWLPAPPGAFWMLLRNYAPSARTVAALADPATFPTPPPIRVVG